MIRDETARRHCNSRATKYFLLSKREKQFTIGADTKAVINDKRKLATRYWKRNQKTSESEIKDVTSRIRKV